MTQQLQLLTGQQIDRLCADYPGNDDLRLQVAFCGMALLGRMLHEESTPEWLAHDLLYVSAVSKIDQITQPSLFARGIGAKGAALIMEIQKTVGWKLEFAKTGEKAGNSTKLIEVLKMADKLIVDDVGEVEQIKIKFEDGDPEMFCTLRCHDEWIGISSVSQPVTIEEREDCTTCHFFDASGIRRLLCASNISETPVDLSTGVEKPLWLGIN